MKKIRMFITVIFALIVGVLIGGTIYAIYDQDLVADNMEDFVTIGFEETKDFLKENPHETTYVKLDAEEEKLWKNWNVINRFDGEFAYILEDGVLTLTVGKRKEKNSNCKIYNVTSAGITTSEELSSIDGFDADSSNKPT